jgi:anti-sigma B factor antagonist
MSIQADQAVGRASGSAGAIEMHGQVNRGSEEAVNAAYDAATAGGVTTLALHFKDVEYINSTGIAVIVGVLARARKDGISVSAHGLTEHYKHIFQITRLSDFMSIEDGTENTGGVS